MSDIFREVDEAMQKEKFERIWHEYKTTIIACIIILIAGTAISTAYKSWNMERNAVETGRLINAMEATNPTEQISTIIEDTRRGHKAIANMLLANEHIEKEEYLEAAGYYNEIIEQGSASKDIKNLARILTVQNNSQLPAENQKTAEDQLKLLKPILKDKKNPWIWHALIEASILEADQKNNFEAAIKYLAPFKDTNYIPLTLKKRAESLSHVYALKNKIANTEAGE